MANSYSIKFDLNKKDFLKNKLEKNEFNFFEIEHAIWRAKNKEITITLYKSGKLLVQGKNPEEFIKKYIDNSKTIENNSKKNNNPVYDNWIGTDESGKGDYFGPLVIAGVYADNNNLKQLSGLGIQDSKKLNDSIIKKLAPEIKNISAFSVITINPAKYNELYKKIGNLNNLLAWGHARAIENILIKKPCQNALSDKFGNETLIKNALLKQGKNINLEQRTKAEDDIAVAAASILARDEFVKRINKLSNEYNISFSKGASDAVISQAKKFVDKYGEEKLSQIAKLHFKTTLKVIACNNAI